MPATTPTRAFPDPARPKAFYLERVRHHREADELVRGVGWDGSRGCGIGCTLERYDHAIYPAELGVPLELAHLEDWLFENLPEDHKGWPERFLEAIPEGADLSGVYPAWCVRLLTRCLERIGPGEEPWRVACRNAVVRIRDLHNIDPGYRDNNRWSAARSAAWSASRLAEAASRSAEAAAQSAEAAAWPAARSAAWSAAWSASWSAAWSAEIRTQATDLLDLLSAAPYIRKS